MIARETLLESAVAAARAAGAVLLEKWGSRREIEHKGAIDLLTDADPAAEAAALAVIRERHPDHAILAEESGAAEVARSAYRWILDPLDGTTNYANDVPQFAVNIACEHAGAIVVGVTLDPIRDELFSASRGGGAWLNGSRIHVGQKTEVQEALLSTGFPYWIQERPQPALDLFSAYLLRARGVRRFGAAALDLAWLACGRFDGFFELGLKPWDVAAGWLIVEEAGGVVTHLDGSPFDLTGGQILASGPGLHEALLAIAAPFFSGGT